MSPKIEHPLKRIISLVGIEDDEEFDTALDEYLTELENMTMSEKSQFHHLLGVTPEEIVEVEKRQAELNRMMREEGREEL